MKRWVWMTILCLHMGLAWSGEEASWKNKETAPFIEEIVKEGGESLIILTNGAILRLRPVMYYVQGLSDYIGKDTNSYFLARRKYDNVDEIKSNWDLQLDFVVGQPCQIVLPHEKWNDRYKSMWFAWVWDPFYKETYENIPIDKTSWRKVTHYTYYYDTIPLNFHDTSVNAAPLRATLYEHPHEKYFFQNSFPSSPRSFHYDKGHIVEAELLQFVDTIESVEENLIQFANSKIFANLREEMRWDVEDRVEVHYFNDGIYELRNLSKEGEVKQAVLSDPAFTDLRESAIYKTLQLERSEEQLQKNEIDAHELLYSSIATDYLAQAKLSLRFIDNINQKGKSFTPFSYKGQTAACSDYRPLNHAITRENLEMVNLLLQHDANVREGGSAGYTKEILCILKKEGAANERIKNMKKILKALRKKK